jgi:hypothetical protein
LGGVLNIPVAVVAKITGIDFNGLYSLLILSVLVYLYMVLKIKPQMESTNNTNQ